MYNQSCAQEKHDSSIQRAWFCQKFQNHCQHIWSSIWHYLLTKALREGNVLILNVYNYSAFNQKISQLATNNHVSFYYVPPTGYSFYMAILSEDCNSGIQNDRAMYNQKDATIFTFLNLFKSALHVSGDKFVHPQENFLTIYTAFGTMHCNNKL